MVTFRQLGTVVVTVWISQYHLVSLGLAWSVILLFARAIGKETHTRGPCPGELSILTFAEVVAKTRAEEDCFLFH